MPQSSIYIYGTAAPGCGGAVGFAHDEWRAVLGCGRVSPINVEHRHSCLCRLVFIFKLLDQRPSAQISGKKVSVSHPPGLFCQVSARFVPGYPPPCFLHFCCKQNYLPPTGPWATLGRPKGHPAIRLLAYGFWLLIFIPLVIAMSCPGLN